MTSASDAPRVALLGLGVMGGGMARRLLDAGFPLTVYNRTASKADGLVADGARLAGTPRDAASGATVIISMVADDPASREVWLGEDGALRGATAGVVLIECSTLSPQWIRELAKAATDRECELLDAPVTGSRTQAAAGELKFLVGGSAQALERAQPVLAVMGRSIMHIGPTGSGSLLKLVNNFLCGVQAASVAEALTLIERSGLDRDKALEVLTTGAPGSPLIKTVLPRMTGHNYAPHFHLTLMAKDLAYAFIEGERHRVRLETGLAALGQFRRALADGFDEQDMAAVIEPLREE